MGRKPFFPWNLLYNDKIPGSFLELCRYCHCMVHAQNSRFYPKSHRKAKNYLEILPSTPFRYFNTIFTGNENRNTFFHPGSCHFYHSVSAFNVFCGCGKKMRFTIYQSNHSKPINSPLLFYDIGGNWHAVSSHLQLQLRFHESPSKVFSDWKDKSKRYASRLKLNIEREIIA